MVIPKHDEIRVPALKLLENHKILKLKEFEAPLSKEFNLTNDDLITMYESGNGPVFYDRISWALSYLSMAGLVNKPRRGYYEITELGRKLLQTPGEVDSFITQTIKKREKPKNKITNVFIDENDLTPQEKIDIAFNKVKESVYNDILDTILSKSPREFEKLVVKLLQKMGYGGEIEGSGIVTQYSNDQGIDGIIKEDVLGLGLIHIQAKRYKLDCSIGRDDLNKFVGALAGNQSSKGVFITTSSFTKGAIEYANNLNGVTLVLIDGIKLAQYIYDYSLGMQTEQVIEIKKLDSDFWDIMEDNL